MIQASQHGTTATGIRPFAVVLQSDRLSIATLPEALPFQVMEVETWEGVFNKLSSFRPGCLIIDLDSDREQTMEMIRHYANQGIRFTMVGVTADRSRKTLHWAIRNGFVDLIPRPMDSRTLIDAVSEAFDVDSQGRDSLCELRSCFGKLTPKEREILPHFLLGVPSRKLAGQFLVSYQTIDRHRKHVIEKMQVENMTELAMKLFRQY